MMTDPIADLLTRVRNANRNGRKTVSMPASRLKVNVAQVLVEEGFLTSYELKPGEPASTLVVSLKYGLDGERAITEIKRVSKPGCRVYRRIEQLPRVLRGLGIYVLSTSKGVMSDRRAREMKVGGEVLARVL